VFRNGFGLSGPAKVDGVAMVECQFRLARDQTPTRSHLSFVVNPRSRGEIAKATVCDDRFPLASAGAVVRQRLSVRLRVSASAAP
jgi:hypothetical protein